MILSFRRLTVVTSILTLIAFAPGAVVPTHAEPAPTDRAGLDAYIRDYILNNPQVVREALLKLELAEEVARTKRVLTEHKEALYEAGSPEIGPADAKVTIVAFFDYNCPYCRATYPELKAYLEANPDTKVVLKDIASLGKESEAVARVVIAAKKQGKVADLHDALMSRKGQVTEAVALDAAAKLGLDIERLKADARTSETGDELTRAQDLATSLNVAATPLYIIGHNGIAGAPDDLAAQIAKYAAEIRTSGCEVC
ncbi:MAG: DsbA family protein [Rhizobiales bacterium]|nr:DsbA family protein [Hyphomicrobiales bacterium]